MSDWDVVEKRAEHDGLCILNDAVDGDVDDECDCGAGGVLPALKRLQAREAQLEAQLQELQCAPRSGDWEVVDDALESLYASAVDNGSRYPGIESPRDKGVAAVARMSAERERMLAREAQLVELLTRNSLAKYGQTEPDVVEALRDQANRVRAHSGFDPGAAPDKLADDILAALASDGSEMLERVRRAEEERDRACKELMDVHDALHASCGSGHDLAAEARQLKRERDEAREALEALVEFAQEGTEFTDPAEGPEPYAALKYAELVLRGDDPEVAAVLQPLSKEGT